VRNAGAAVCHGWLAQPWKIVTAAKAAVAHSGGAFLNTYSVGAGFNPPLGPKARYVISKGC